MRRHYPEAAPATGVGSGDDDVEVLALPGVAVAASAEVAEQHVVTRLEVDDEILGRTAADAGGASDQGPLGEFVLDDGTAVRERQRCVPVTADHHEFVRERSV